MAGGFAELVVEDDCCKKEDEDQMGRKISLCLILGLVLIGLCVAPVAASAAFALPNGDCWGESDGYYGFYYHNDTGITDTWHTNPLKGNGLVIPSIPKVTPGNTNSYSNTLLPQTNPSPIIIKPLPTLGKTNGVSRFTQYIK